MKPGDIISYQEMCAAEGLSLQRGMNFRSRGRDTIILMSTRSGAPYADRLEGDGRVLIDEGHDVPKNATRKPPKSVDQEMRTPSGRLSENGRFFEAASAFKKGAQAEPVRVYEKIKDGIWTYNGTFLLTDAWTESDSHRQVFRFRLELSGDTPEVMGALTNNLGHDRVIPSSVKLDVWKRDKGRCRLCGSTDNLHFDHDIPFSKGGSSLTVENIQLLCARHNLQKKDRIE